MAKITMGENMKNRLLDIRLDLGYKKQKDFAKFLGVNNETYNRWEMNRVQPNEDSQIKICKKLKITKDKIFNPSK